MRDLDSLENFNYLWDDVWLIQQQEEESDGDEKD